MRIVSYIYLKPLDNLLLFLYDSRYTSHKFIYFLYIFVFIHSDDENFRFNKLFQHSFLGTSQNFQWTVKNQHTNHPHISLLHKLNRFHAIPTRPRVQVDNCREHGICIQVQIKGKINPS